MMSLFSLLGTKFAISFILDSLRPSPHSLRAGEERPFLRSIWTSEDRSSDEAVRLPIRSALLPHHRFDAIIIFIIASTWRLMAPCLRLYAMLECRQGIVPCLLQMHSQLTKDSRRNALCFEVGKNWVRITAEVPEIFGFGGITLREL